MALLTIVAVDTVGNIDAKVLGMRHLSATEDDAQVTIYLFLSEQLLFLMGWDGTCTQCQRQSGARPLATITQFATASQ